MIEAVIVNHNTSAFAELCLRSLRASEDRAVGMRVTVADNDSDDDGVGALRDAAAECGARFERSRWPYSESTVNTHGDVLRDFVLGSPDALYYLFLDADVVFTQRHSVSA